MDLKMYGHWISFEDVDVTKHLGFVYLIKNLLTDKKYIGKKQYWLKNGKKKSTVTDRTSDKWKEEAWKESNWKSYTSSSKYLNEDIKKHGKENFTFIILHQWKCKGDLHYAEILEQVQRNVLHERLDYDEEERAYYNGQIAGVKFIPPGSHSKETRQKLKDAIKRNGHPMQGKVHPNKGKKLPQCAPKMPKARGAKHITNGIENKWLPREEVLPKGWRYGITRRDKGRALSDKELLAKKKASESNAHTQHCMIASRAGFSSYEDFVEYILSLYDAGINRADIARDVYVSWTTVNNIINKRKVYEWKES